MSTLSHRTTFVRLYTNFVLRHYDMIQLRYFIFSDGSTGQLRGIQSPYDDLCDFKVTGTVHFSNPDNFNMI